MLLPAIMPVCCTLWQCLCLQVEILIEITANKRQAIAQLGSKYTLLALLEALKCVSQMSHLR